MMSFDKEKLAPLKAAMVLIIVADHLALFYGITQLHPFIHFGAPIVSMFFFISGYGLQVSYDRNGEAYLRSFFSHRFWKVLAPYLLTTLLYCLFVWKPETSIGRAVVESFVNGVPILPFSWFVIDLLILYIAYYLAYKLFVGRWKIIVLLILSLLLMALAIFIGYDQGWWICTLAFPSGILFARSETRLFAFCEKRILNYCLIILALTGAFFLLYMTGNPYVWTLCHVCIPFVAALIIAKVPLQKLNAKVVTFLAMISYEIYLCQGIAMELLRNVIYLRNDALFVFLVYVITIVLAWIIHFLSSAITQP